MLCWPSPLQNIKDPAQTGHGGLVLSRMTAMCLRCLRVRDWNPDQGRRKQEVRRGWLSEQLHIIQIQCSKQSSRWQWSYLHWPQDANPLPSSGQYCSLQISVPDFQGKDPQQAASQPVQTLGLLQGLHIVYHGELLLSSMRRVGTCVPWARTVVIYKTIVPQTQNPTALLDDKTPQQWFRCCFCTMTSNPYTLGKDYAVCSPSAKDKTTLL